MVQYHGSVVVVHMSSRDVGRPEPLRARNNVQLGRPGSTTMETQQPAPGPIERVKYGWTLYTRIARLTVEAKILEREILKKKKLMGPRIFDAMSEGNHEAAEVMHFPLLFSNRYFVDRLLFRTFSLNAKLK